MHGENDQLNSEIQRLRTEIDRLQSAHDTAVNDARALKLQLDEQNLVTTNSPSTTTVCRFSYLELIACLIRFFFNVKKNKFLGFS